MKNRYLIGFCRLLSLASMASAVGCVVPTGQSDGRTGNESQKAKPAPQCTPLAQSGGSANPASVYCAALGYQLQGENCVFSDGTSCEQWSFYRGECGQAHSFCNLNGGSVANKTEDMGGWTASYAVCTLASGAKCDEETFAHTCSCEPVTPKPAPAPAPQCTPLAEPSGTANPASVYCGELGYQLDNEQCVFADGTICEQWAFYRGECGQAHSFCNLHGGSVANKIEDMGGWTASYAVCTLPSGEQCAEDTFAHKCSCQ